MRTLNDYFIGAEIADLGSATATGASQVVVVPDAGELVAIAITVDANVDADTTADILVNGTDTTTDVTFTAADLGADTGGLFRPAADVFLQEGDSLQITSNGEATTTPLAGLAFIIRR